MNPTRPFWAEFAHFRLGLTTIKPRPIDPIGLDLTYSGLVWLWKPNPIETILGSVWPTRARVESSQTDFNEALLGLGLILSGSIWPLSNQAQPGVQFDNQAHIQLDLTPFKLSSIELFGSLLRFLPSFYFLFLSNLLLFMWTTYMSRRMLYCLDYTFIYASSTPFFYGIMHKNKRLHLFQLFIIHNELLIFFSF